MRTIDRRETSRGFGLSGRDLQVIGGASALLAINVLLMAAFVATPLAEVNQLVFGPAPILGVIVYGVAIVGGELLAERGLERADLGVAVLGVAVLQLAFGAFGAGILTTAPVAAHATVLAVTALLTAAILAVITTYVYARSTTFEHWGRYAGFAFLGGVGIIAVGSFVFPLLLLFGFVLIFLGFLLRLGYEIWNVRDNRDESIGVQTLGVYVAIAGVFVHVLQLVVRYLASQD